MSKYMLVIGLAVVAIGAVVAVQMQSQRAKTESSIAASQPPPGSGGAAMAYAGKVMETMNSGGYTYVRVDTGDEILWAAAPETEVTVGETVSFPTGMEMRDFRSETLDRTFDVVYFVAELRHGEGAPSGAPSGAGRMPAEHPPVASPQDAAEGMDFSMIEVPSGGARIAALYADKASLAGKDVVVRGRVVKFTPGVMGKNWIHIMDGSGEAGKNDLTVTTDATVQVGDVVLVRGVMNLDKDFGMGYAYEILVEDAKVTVE